MANTHRRPSRQLSYDDAVQIHLLILDGWFQSRIAAHFDTNSGRISEVNTGKRWPTSKADALSRTNKDAA